MSSQPAPIVSGTGIIQTVEKDISWVKGHVIALVIALAVVYGSVLGGIGVVEHFVTAHDEKVSAQTSAKVQQDTITQQTLLAQLQKEEADAETRDAQQNALITSLVRQMQSEHAATAKQVATDATLDANTTAQRIAAQTKAPQTDVTAINDTVILTLPVARTVTEDLDLLVQSQNDVTNLQGQLDAQKIETNDAKVELDTAKKTVDADQTKLTDTVKADAAACDVRVDKATATWRKRTVWGTVLGFVAGVITKY